MIPLALRQRARALEYLQRAERADSVNTRHVFELVARAVYFGAVEVALMGGEVWVDWEQLKAERARKAA